VQVPRSRGPPRAGRDCHGRGAASSPGSGEFSLDKQVTRCGIHTDRRSYTGAGNVEDYKLVLDGV
jgi:hypothetical protein